MGAANSSAVSKWNRAERRRVANAPTKGMSRMIAGQGLAARSTLRTRLAGGATTDAANSSHALKPNLAGLLLAAHAPTNGASKRKHEQLRVVQEQMAKRARMEDLLPVLLVAVDAPA